MGLLSERLCSQTVSYILLRDAELTSGSFNEVWDIAARVLTASVATCHFQSAW